MAQYNKSLREKPCKLDSKLHTATTAHGFDYLQLFYNDNCKIQPTP